MKNTEVMDNANTRFLGNKKLRIALVLIFLAAALIVIMSSAHALQAGGATLHNQFDGIWDEVKGLMTGSPAKILMGLSIIGVLAFALVKPNLIGFGASVVTLLVMANAVNTIDTGLTLTVGALSKLPLM